jgi:hypothetical protein
MTDATRKFFAAFLIAGISSLSQTSTSSAQDNGILGTWRTMIGSPSTYSQPSSSVVFTTAFEPNGAYRTVAVVEGGDGVWGAGGTYVMTGHYELQTASVLMYRLENSVLCVAGNVCSPAVPPGERLGGVVSVNLQFEGSDGLYAGGPRWSRLQ